MMQWTSTAEATSTSRIANFVKSALAGAKKTVGSVLGNESMQASGKIQQAEAHAANLAARAEQQVKGVAHEVKGTVLLRRSLVL
ncbi:hypothetical protein BGZ58_002295 [Dissophora ornata]|nr:hypothetical protein BGZ58_002295 [Dissophora ornata]